MPRLTFPVLSSTALVAVGDPDRDRTVYAAIVLLVALGFGLIMLAVWLLRNTRPDPEVLAPLERMGERKWRRADPVWQRRRLDEVRPGGADPLEPTSAPPATDAEFERGPQPIGFDDLVAASSSTVTVASELPAPAPGTMARDAPVAVDGDGEDAPEAEPDNVSAPYEDHADATDSPGDAVAATDDENDEDEDITGEQDTDDFFTVLETDADTDAEADADVDVGHDDDPADGAAGDAVADEHADVSDDRREVRAASPEDDAPG